MDVVLYRNFFVQVEGLNRRVDVNRNERRLGRVSHKEYFSFEK